MQLALNIKHTVCLHCVCVCLSPVCLLLNWLVFTVKQDFGFGYSLPLHMKYRLQKQVFPGSVKTFMPVNVGTCLNV